MLDGATNSTQDQVFRKHRISGSSMMVYLNLFSALLMISYLIVGPYLPSPIATNELAEALQFCFQHHQLAFDIALFALCGAVGQCFIFATLERFGSLLLVTINVTRKMFTILLSAFWFQHEFSIEQWISVSIVFAGIILETIMKRRESRILKETVVARDKKSK